MALPASEDTRANRMAYVVNTKQVDHIMFTNDSGADVNQGDIAIIGPYVAFCDEDIANGAEGSIHVTEGIQIQVSDLVAGEDTFGTIGQRVYFDATAGEFSDTSTIGYYHVGFLTKVKDSNGKIEFEKLRHHSVIS